MYPITTPSGVVVEPPQGRCWKNLEEVYLQYLKEGRLWFGADGKGVPRQKTYLFERNGKIGWSWWPNSEVGHNQEATQELRNLLQSPSFDFPKPVRLLKRIVALAAKDDDIIMDFFSGSATTAHAVMQLNAEDGGNRRFILVQLPEACDEKSEAYRAGYRNICEIGKERIRRAGVQLMESVTSGVGSLRGDGWGCGMPETPEEWDYAIGSVLDIGFRVFKLDSSNLKEWNAAPITGEQVELLTDRMNEMTQRVKPDRTDMDMVCEIMLKLGVPLTYAVDKLDIGGKAVYTVGDDSLLLICLAPDVVPEDIEAMSDYAPAKVIISRESFADDTAMANAYYILRDRGIELKLV